MIRPAFGSQTRFVARALGAPESEIGKIQKIAIPDPIRRRNPHENSA
jgi:hypothetical protein